ncbi:MAG: hypothetical protein WKG07_41180 [Hymenobacter sp.]
MAVAIPPDRSTPSTYWAYRQPYSSRGSRREDDRYLGFVQKATIPGPMAAAS